ncbi:NADH dehydrogenase subunit 2 (mitochondrion) [Rhopilema esculentum]|uniref:NADH:ubiquinone reductase (H(+)-translocating) n=1 Tax=Rhopilema esculentum TaxID=499914 RepID=A0A222YV84_9CNID|nr:NADH dehydrogenase subunit 2 [Rhopilema esculentum]ASR75171.1 NADH dehydrogenase subunit 2 [Rhopilema esculentum]
MDNSNVLILCITLASMVIVSCSNLLCLYLTLELQSLSVFILIARKREIVSRIEASLKYFILSSISSGLFLLGSSLVFLNAGTYDITVLSLDAYFIEKSLILVSLLFKLAASPFHFWSPDVYQGSDNKALLVLGTLPKISILGVLLLLIPNSKLLLLATILSLIIGCVGAINQTKLKRLMAYSSIVGMGFILMGVSVYTFEGLEAGILYLLIYLLTFAGIIIIADKTIEEKSTIVELSNFLGSNVVLLGSFSLLVLSLAGIPPLGGFLAKWFIISTAINNEFLITSILSIICAMVAGVYYLRLVKISYFQHDKLFLVWRKVLLKKSFGSDFYGVTTGIIVYFVLFFLLSPHILQETLHFGVLSIF